MQFLVLTESQEAVRVMIGMGGNDVYCSARPDTNCSQEGFCTTTTCLIYLKDLYNQPYYESQSWVILQILQEVHLFKVFWKEGKEARVFKISRKGKTATKEVCQL